MESVFCNLCVGKGKLPLDILRNPDQSVTTIEVICLGCHGTGKVTLQSQKHLINSNVTTLLRMTIPQTLEKLDKVLHSDTLQDFSNPESEAICEDLDTVQDVIRSLAAWVEMIFELYAEVYDALEKEKDGGSSV